MMNKTNCTVKNPFSKKKNKNILKHNKFVICNKCQKICHAKCANKLYNFNFIEDSWVC